jgi:DNA-binding transcriptional regulator GbsR (MarR family)
MGSQWGINRTMAQIHALLLTSREALCADDIMEELAISRGNAHMNLRELTQWGLIRRLLKRGDRKEYFEAEKELWKIFTIIASVRKQREIDPALDAVRQCVSDTKDVDTIDGRAFHEQMNDLYRFLTSASATLEHIVSAPHPGAMSWSFSPHQERRAGDS